MALENGHYDLAMILFEKGARITFKQKITAADLALNPNPDLPSRSQLWALAAGGIITESNKKRHDLLGGRTNTEKNRASKRRSLSKGWKITSRDDAFKQLTWLEEEGHRYSFAELYVIFTTFSKSQIEQVKAQHRADPATLYRFASAEAWHQKLGPTGISSWNFCRYINVVGSCYVAGYISEKEAWTMIIPMAYLIQNTYSSWKGMAIAHYLGYCFWRCVDKDEKRWSVIERLLTKSNSLCKKIPFKMKLKF